MGIPSNNSANLKAVPGVGQISAKYGSFVFLDHPNLNLPHTNSKLEKLMYGSSLKDISWKPKIGLLINNCYFLKNLWIVT